MKLRKINDKKGISEVVAYVLLIGISLSLATMVFFWLKGQLPKDVELSCDEGLSLNIRDYEYSCSSPEELNVTIQNKGRFNAAGFILRVNNESGREIGLYVLEDSIEPMQTGETRELSYSSFTDNITGVSILGNLAFLEIQPKQNKDGKTFICDDFVSKINLVCS